MVAMILSKKNLVGMVLGQSYELLDVHIYTHIIYIYMHTEEFIMTYRGNMKFVGKQQNFMGKKTEPNKESFSIFVFCNGFDQTKLL